MATSATSLDGWLANVTQESFVDFVRHFWDVVPGAGKLEWNWHMEYLCQELQEIAQRVFDNQPKKYDLIINISPGSSKSSLCSILFPAWIWTRMPEARFITASHTDLLVLDLANKARQVIYSDQYQRCFPNIQMRSDQDSKGYYANTLGGARLTCTVSGKSPLGFHAHFLICLPYETDIITEDGILPIGNIVENRLPVKVLGWDHEAKCSCWQSITDYGKNPGRPLCRIVFDDGSVLEATEDHPIFVLGKGYASAGQLETNDEVINVVSMPAVWKGDLSLPIPCGKNKNKMDFLFSRMPCNFYEREESLSVFEYTKTVQSLREDYAGKKWSNTNSFLLQQTMLSQSKSGRKSLEIQTNRGGLWLLWDGIEIVEMARRIISKSLLFSELCQQGPRREDEGERKPQLYSWEWICPLFQRSYRASQTNSEKGEFLLFSLSKNGRRQWPGIGGSSCRLGQKSQCLGKSSSLVQELPPETTRRQEETFKTGKKIVAFVERKIRIPNAVYNIGTTNHNYFAGGVLVHNCDDPLDPKRAVSNAELKTAADFMSDTLPSRKINKETAVTILIMQRLHREDPTGILLARARREGAGQIRHICLPAELSSNIHPPELADKYVDGLMDPTRLSKTVVKEFRATLGNWAYSGQFMQSPIQIEGGMFKEQWFNHRVKSAPYYARRIRYWDRASSTTVGGCYTAGVLMAKDQEGNFFVEDVVHGQWEPDERNQRMRATGLRDRTRYGLENEPVIWVEAEGGSSGRDAWKGVVRALVGFVAREDRVSGKKEVRAEPWACQVAAGNVFLVEGNWDINGYIQEHLHFPQGRLKDQVDASTGAFNLLVGMRQQIPLRTIPLKNRKVGKLQIFLCSREQLAELALRQNCLLIMIDNHSPLQREEVTSHGLGKVAGMVKLYFADLDPGDYQEQWEELVEPYHSKIEDVILKPEQGKAFWRELLRDHNPPLEALVIQDDGEEDGRGLSIACAVCDVLGLKRAEIVSKLAIETKEKPPNQYVFSTIKKSRSMVVR